MNSDLFRILIKPSSSSLLIAGMLMPALAGSVGIGTPSDAWLVQDRTVRETAGAAYQMQASLEDLPRETQSVSASAAAVNGHVTPRARKDPWWMAPLTRCGLTEVAKRTAAEKKPAKKYAVNHPERGPLKRIKPTATRVSEKDALLGIASFYDDTETASGEKFDACQMTAAHRTLPFGTRLRVVDLATGHSVTVRINDRGPYIAGRIVDLSPSAAARLGIVERGITKVKLEIVEKAERKRPRRPAPSRYAQACATC